jgi:hypothetical protein
VTRAALLFVVACAACAACAACDDGVPKPAAMLPVTRDEATAVALKFAEATTPCNVDKLDPLVDSTNLARRAANKSHVRPDMKRELLKELDRRDFSVAKQLCIGFPPDVRMDLLRVRQVGDNQRPLLRMSSNATFNYYDLEVGKPRAGGEPIIVDMLDFYSGNLLSETVADGMGIGVSSAMRGEHIDPQAVATARASGDWNAVRDAVRAMPPKVRASRIFRLAELQAAMQLQDPAYLELVTSFEHDFPDDPALLLLVIDGYAMKKDGPKLLAAIDRLDRKVGGDPYLELHRAGAYTLDPTPGNLAKAEQSARAFIAAMPEVQNGWWTLATVQLQRGDLAGVVPTLDAIKQRFAVTFSRDAMAAQPIYEAFLRSPEFEAWWARQ